MYSIHQEDIKFKDIIIIAYAKVPLICPVTTLRVYMSLYPTMFPKDPNLTFHRLGFNVVYNNLASWFNKALYLVVIVVGAH